MSDAKSQSGENEPHSVTPLEKIATGISAILVALLVAALVWDSVHPDAPAKVTVQMASPSIIGSQYQVPLTIQNRGDQSAKDVVVHVELVAEAGDSVIAESELTIDWLPRESSRNAVGLFDQPQIVPVRVRADVRGYVVP